jgi:hypothetical protein
MPPTMLNLLLGLFATLLFFVSSGVAFLVPRSTAQLQSRPQNVYPEVLFITHHAKGKSKQESTAVAERKDRTWEESFELLKGFKEEHGHCNVPDKYKEDPKLGKWVSKQRLQHRKDIKKREIYQTG